MARSYKLTRQAQYDLKRIAAFGAERFGKDRTRIYISSLRQRFVAIAEAPLRWPVVDDEPSLRKSVHQAHTIYYSAHDSVVVIVRVFGHAAPPL